MRLSHSPRHIAVGLCFVASLFLLAVPASSHAAWGGALANNTGGMGDFGPLLSSAVSSGGSYAGLTSTVTAGTDAGGRPVFLSTLTLLGGLASANITASIQWRAATAEESLGTSTVPPMHDSAGWAALVSDVADLSGIAPNGGGSGGGRTQTDVFALQMTYDQITLVATFQCPGCVTFGWTEQDIIDAGEIQMGYLDLGDDNVVGGSGANADFWSDEDLVILVQAQPLSQTTSMTLMVWGATTVAVGRTSYRNTVSPMPTSPTS